MKASQLAVPIGVLTLLLCVPASLLAKKPLTDYQMRIHIYETHWHHNGWGFHAFGRANLFDQKGAPHGVEYTYDCGYHLMASTGREAYPAMWKKQGQSIDVAFGEIGGNPKSFHDCGFKIAIKQFVYYRERGGLGTESAADFLAKEQKQTPSVGPATPADVPFAANQQNPF